MMIGQTTLKGNWHLRNKINLHQSLRRLSHYNANLVHSFLSKLVVRPRKKVLLHEENSREIWIPIKIRFVIEQLSLSCVTGVDFREGKIRCFFSLSR